MSSIQKALLLDEKSREFAVAQVPREKPGRGEILIKVQSAALNPVDWKIQKWGWLIDGYPAVLGSDIAGDVEEIGEGVLEFKKGDRVFGQADYKKTRGAFQQYVVSLAATVSKIPPNFSYDEVSTVPLALTTAYSGLYSRPITGLGLDAPVSEEARGKYAGTPFFVIGGSSSVGQFVIQLAKLSGFSPIIATASLKNTDSLKDLGATHVLDRTLSADALKIEIAKITSNTIAYAYDTISDGITQQTVHDVLAPGGRATIVLPSPVTQTATEGRVIGQVFASLRAPHNVELLEKLYHDNIYSFLENGLIIPNRVEVLKNGLAGVSDGLVRLENNQVSMLKLVARPQEN